MKKKPLSRLTANLFGISNAGMALVTTFSLGMGTYFMTDIARLPVSMATVINLILSISSMVLSPFYGVLISKLPEMPWGRIRSWLLVMPPFVLVFCFFEFGCFTDNVLIRGAIICIGGILAHTFWTMAYTALTAMLGPLSSNGTDRARLNARKTQLGTVGSIVYSATVSSLLTLCVSIAGGEKGGYQLQYMIYAVVYCITYFVEFAITKGYEPTKAERLSAAEAGEGNDQALKKERVTIKAMLIGFVKNPPLLLLICNDVSIKLINYVVNTMIVYYYNIVAQEPALYSVHLTLINVMGLVGAWFAPKLSDKFGNKGAFQAGWIITIVGLVGARLFAYQTYLFMAFMAIYGISHGARNAVNHATYGDAAVYAEALTGEDTKTFVYSMTSIPGTIASLLRTLVVGAALTASGYVAGADPTPAMQSGVISALVTIPLICSIAGGIIMTIYPLNQKRLAECQAKIDSGVSG